MLTILLASVCFGYQSALIHENRRLVRNKARHDNRFLVRVMVRRTLALGEIDLCRAIKDPSPIRDEIKLWRIWIGQIARNSIILDGTQ
jgi:hypothetical protein